MGETHNHSHDHGRLHDRTHHEHAHGQSHLYHHRGRRKSGDASANIAFTFLLNLGFVLIEFIGGALTGSVAILADAVHDLGDCLSLGLAWVLERWSEKARSSEFSYGYGRFSLLAALTSGGIIAAGSLVILFTAIPRLWEPAPAHGLGMLALAILGVVVNGWAALRLARGESASERMLLWHYVEDVLGWVAVLVGAAFIAWKGWNWIDPLLAVGISLFVLWNVIKNLRSTVKLFLQSVPEGFNERDFLRTIRVLPGVREVHDLHIWSIDGNQHILSLHVELDDKNADAMEIKRKIRETAKNLGDYHTTIEIEAPAETCGDKC